MKRTVFDVIIKFLKIITVIIVIYLVVRFNQGSKPLTVESLLDYSPNEPIYAALFLIGLYLMKPIVLTIPIPVLQIVTGIIFTPLLAIFVSLLGLTLCTSISYGLGRLLGQEKIYKLLEKRKKGAAMLAHTESNPFYYVLIVRAVGIISMDLTGMFFGSIQIAYRQYLLASLLGLLPALIMNLFIGIAADDPSSIEFIVAVSLRLLLIFVSYALYRKNFSQKKGTSL